MKPKLGKNGSTSFAAVEFESLPKRFCVERDVAQGTFFELMRNIPDIDKASLDEMMPAAHMFKTTPVIMLVCKLSGAYVKDNGEVDFLIARGKKSVCIVEARHFGFKKGSFQGVLGMAVDNINEECVYRIVTNYVEWKHPKRTCAGIEQFGDVVKRNNVSPQSDIKHVASRLHAIFSAC
ncbi:hypothetical protein PR003_g21071 [Phytophthora rubi]|uniref:Uncharacterized protein n=1 Tax=Phytophthora rubi TaxID=129364 RepID=A0A6A3LTM1_9STRA|nr:hypothetical protein PR002_g18898 [Phytophthora rubi]KAE9022981.1 hypothetical protein PR001_g13023 [Phytophthora rubi]KAE9307144.1 hypothetical protein PR003_g21071 [Phytophthora rubi]